MSKVIFFLPVCKKATFQKATFWNRDLLDAASISQEIYEYLKWP